MCFEDQDQPRDACPVIAIMSGQGLGLCKASGSGGTTVTRAAWPAPTLWSSSYGRLARWPCACDKPADGSLVVVRDVDERDLARDGGWRGRCAPVRVVQEPTPAGLFLDVARQGIEGPHGPKGWSSSIPSLVTR